MSRPDHRGNIAAFYSARMIELQNDGIGLATIHAWMRREVLVKEEAIRNDTSSPLTSSLRT